MPHVLPTLAGAMHARAACRCRYSNLTFMPPTILPEDCQWPHGPNGPQPGLIPALLGYITLVNSR